jgi:MazG family protein
MTDAQPASGLIDLLRVMRALRNLQTGCPWDKEQTFASLAPYAIEEAYEVEDAIARGDMRDLKEELGDLLFQVVFHAQIAQEQGLFDFDDIAKDMTQKLINRHPHVFGDVEMRSADEQNLAWEETKAHERLAKQKTGILDDVPLGLPALTRAEKLAKRVARVGFDWPDVAQVFVKLEEEMAELKVEIEAGRLEKAKGELGDVLFNIVNLGCKLDIDPEASLRLTNAKFIRRFRYIEAELRAKGSSPEQASLTQMNELWDAAKLDEHA